MIPVVFVATLAIAFFAIFGVKGKGDEGGKQYAGD